MRKSIKKTIAILCTIAVLIGMLTLAVFASEGWPPNKMPDNIGDNVHVTVRVYRGVEPVPITGDPAAPNIMVWYRAADLAGRGPSLEQTAPGYYMIPSFNIPGLQVGDRIYLSQFHHMLVDGTLNPADWPRVFPHMAQEIHWNVYSLLTVDDVLFREARGQSRWFYFLRANARPLVEPLPDLSLGHHGVAHAPDSIEFIPATADTLDKFILEISKCADRVAVDFSQLIGDAPAGDVSVNGLTINPPVGGNPDHVIHIYDGGWDSFARSAYVMVGAPPQGEYREVELIVEVDGNEVGRFIVKIIRAEPFNEGGVLFREARAPSRGFYFLGAEEFPGNDDTTRGHFGDDHAEGAIDFVDCPIPTFTLNVAACADRLAIDIAGLIECRATFELFAAWQDVGQPNPANNFRIWMEDAGTLYDNPDLGWGAGAAHLPAYFMVWTPAQGQSRTLVMIVDGVEFHVIINRALNDGLLLFREARPSSAWFYAVGAGKRPSDYSTETHGHFGTPPGAVEFDADTNTFTLTVSCIADRVAVDFRGLIGNAALATDVAIAATGDGIVGTANLIGTSPGVAIYTNIDDGWGDGHLPAYIMIWFQPANWDERTINLQISVNDVVVGEFTVVIVRQEQTVTVGAQQGAMTARAPGTVTFPVITTCIPDGYYYVNVATLPTTGVTAPQRIRIEYGIGELVLTGNNQTVAGTTPLTLVLTLAEPDCPSFDAYIGTLVVGPSEQFTLTIGPATPQNDLTGVGGGAVTPPTVYDDEEVPLAPLSPYHHAYLIGYTDGTIRPNANITRAEVATIFFRLLCDEYRVEIWSQTNPFADVALQAWFNNAISTLASQDYLLGYPDGYFRPNQAMTRAEFSALLVRIVNGGNNGEAGDTPFTDIVGHWAENYIYAAYALGWVQGFGDGTFRPDRQITRAEVAALVNRALNRLPEYPSDLLEDMVTWPDNMNQNAWFYLYIQEATNSHVHELKECGIRETWVELLTPREWWRLERPDSDPTIFTGYYIGEEIGVGE